MFKENRNTHIVAQDNRRVVGATDATTGLSADIDSGIQIVQVHDALDD